MSPALEEPVGGAREASLAQCSRRFLGSVVLLLIKSFGLNHILFPYLKNFFILIILQTKKYSLGLFMKTPIKSVLLRESSILG